MGIRERIIAHPDLASARASRDIDALAAALNAEGLLDRQPHFVTARAIITLHKTEGRNIMARLRALKDEDIGVEFAVLFLSQEAGLDIGHPDMWANIDDLVALWRASDGAKGLSEAHGAMLKSLALQPVLVTREQVRLAMFNDDGTEKQ